MRIELGEWTPDALDTASGLVRCENAIAYGKHYVPFPGPASLTAPLPEAPVAGYASSIYNGQVDVLVASASKIYQLQVNTWTDRTGAAFVADVPMVWAFAQSGAYDLVATYNNAVRYRQIGSASDFAPITDAPQARVLASVRDFVFAGDINDPTDGQVPNRVRWNAIGDALSWPLPGSAAAQAVQADEQDLKAEYGAVRGIFSSDVGILFQERAITRASYVGVPLIFQFDTVDASRGLFARNAAAQVGRTVFFLADDGFFVNDGSGESVSISTGKIDRWFQADLGYANRDLIQCLALPEQRCVVWFYPSVSAEINDSALIYSYGAKRWSYARLPIVIAFTARSPGYGLDTLDAFGDVDTIGTTFDSVVWQPRQSLPSVMGPDYRLSSLTGDPLVALFETTEFGMEGRRSFLRGVRPLVEGGEASLQIASRGQLSQPLAWSGWRTPTPATGIADFRSSAFYHRVRLQLAGGFTKAAGVDAVLTRDDGAR